MDKYSFRIAQKAEIKEGEKFLVMKRAPDAHTYPNCWDFPGGRLEQEENPYEGFKREVKEETNLDIGVIGTTFLFSEKLNENHVLFIVHNCELISRDLKLSKEHTEFKWATKEEILELKTENFLRAYFERREENGKA